MIWAVFLGLLFVGLPIALALIMSAILYVKVSGNEVLFASFSQKMFSGAENYGLLAIPLFMLAGEVMNEGGVTTRLVRFARIFVGGFRGGLAYINLLANMFMASILGTATAQIAMMSRVMVPAMVKEGYGRDFAAATTAAGGLLSPIIPPSILFVIFGVLAQVPISEMFLAGIIPGLLLSFSFFVVIAALGIRHGYPDGEWMGRKEVGRALLEGLVAGAIPAIIIASILFGIATPTESAAVASVAAFLAGRFVYRELRLDSLGGILERTVRNSSMVIFLVIAASVFGWIVVYESIPQRVAAWIAEITTDPFHFLLLLNGLLLVVGMVIDPIAALILIVPILLPIAQEQFGIDPYHFGVVVCINLVLGLLTPPVGVGLYLTASVTGSPPLRILRALAPFLLATLVTLLLLSWQEGLATWLVG